MAFPPSVLLLDDGELTDVRRLLETLGVDFVHLRGAGISDGLEAPRDLLLTTARRAQTIPRSNGNGTALPSPVRVVVANEEAETLRDRLRRDGVDFMVRRPVHSEALRLLVLRSLYRGPEKRRSMRVPFGVPVRCDLGETSVDAVLAELSTGGCRLILASGVQPSATIAVTIGPEVDEAHPVTLPGTVLRVHVEGDESYVAAEFDALDAEQEAALAGILLRRAVHPEAARGGADRRSSRRRAFEQTVTTLDQEASRALVGRDLSLGGMRIDPHPELKLGDELRLAIYGFADAAPAIVRASIIRDDGAEGLALRFEGVDDDVAHRLEELVANLPPIEPLGDGETAALGAVVSAILEES